MYWQNRLWSDGQTLLYRIIEYPTAAGLKDSRVLFKNKLQTSYLNDTSDLETAMISVVEQT